MGGYNPYIPAIINSLASRPLPHLGHDLMLIPVSLCIISSRDSSTGGVYFLSSCISFLINLIFSALYRGERKPKYRIFLNLFGNTWSRNLLINSVASRVISFMVSSSRSFQVKVILCIFEDWLTNLSVESIDFVSR